MAAIKDRHLSELVVSSVTNGVAVLALHNPPFNALTAPLRSALSDALTTAVADDAVTHIAIMGQGNGFCTAANLHELEDPFDKPDLSELALQIEDCPKPVVAVLHGSVLWGGLDLALAAHYRIAHRATRVGTPEVRLGIVPFGGATQRLPRLIGAAAALDMLVGGQSYGVDRMPAQGIFDSLFSSDDLAAEAVKFCEALQKDGRGPRKTADATRGFIDAAGYQEVIQTRHTRLSALPETAPAAIVDCVEAAQLLPLYAGLALETQTFEDLRQSDQSKALRRAFVAERKAGQLARPHTDQPVPRYNVLGILGGGPLATHISIAALHAGMKVRWGTKNPEVLKRGLAQIDGFYRQAIKLKRISEDRAKAELANFTMGDAEEMAQGSDVILHAARGQSGVPGPEGVARIKAFPDQVASVALRFAPPAHVHGLVEILQGPEASDADLMACYAIVHRMNKTPIRVKSQGSSVVGRMMASLHRMADILVDLGQSPYDIDNALNAWGWRAAPFATRDGRGLEEFAAAPRAENGRNWSAYLVANGRKGRGEGGGFYGVGENGAMVPDKAVIDLLNATRVPKKKMSDEEIVETLLAAMANETLRMIENGMVSHPLIVDTAMIKGQSFPRWRGGSMVAADLIGLFRLKRRLDVLDHPDTAFFEPRNGWSELVKNGRNFNDLN